VLDIDIPGWKRARLAHLVLDYNGTLAFDGRALSGVKPLLAALSRDIEIHVVTADTFGTAQAMLADFACRLSVLEPQDQAAAKLAYVERLGASQTVCIGNGRNDRLMLEAAALAIAVVQGEGAAIEAILASDVVAPDILTALELLTQPRRLIATLRS
jgi:soluble P-type ATPase